VNSPFLATWACHPLQTRGRRVPQAPSPPRHDHQRDRDRIVHSAAFRRLVYKTQVFINHEGDLFRTRLTHSLEVAQLGRSAARALHLNEDLVEAIALAHDLGHTPFGHAGQDALHTCMQAHGGFEHNLQSLRVVDLLEERYPEFDGLNLTFETREGVLKHCSRRNAEGLCAAEPQGPALRFLINHQPSLEAQLVNLADELAYSAHDVDDGLRSGLLSRDQLDNVPLLAQWRRQVLQEHPQLGQRSPRRLLAESLRRMLSAQVLDLVAATSAAVQQAKVNTVDEVRHHTAPLAQLSAPMREQTDALKRFLFKALYRHPQVTAMTDRARQVVIDLFKAYTQASHEMPEEHRNRGDLHRTVADYIAGMTDRYALREHHRLTGQRLFKGVEPWS
jgi:dGTPase